MKRHEDREYMELPELDREEYEAIMPKSIYLDDIEVNGTDSINTVVNMFRVEHCITLDAKDYEVIEGDYNKIGMFASAIKHGKIHPDSRTFALYDVRWTSEHIIKKSLVFSCNTLEDAIATAINASDHDMNIRIRLVKNYEFASNFKHTPEVEMVHKAILKKIVKR